VAATVVLILDQEVPSPRRQSVSLTNWFGEAQLSVNEARGIHRVKHGSVGPHTYERARMTRPVAFLDLAPISRSMRQSFYIDISNLCLSTCQEVHSSPRVSVPRCLTCGYILPFYSAHPTRPIMGNGACWMRRVQALLSGQERITYVRTEDTTYRMDVNGSCSSMLETTYNQTNQ
jgi:hypothetical protein